MQKDKLEKLTAEKSNPCLTISLNTHRTYPENAQDLISSIEVISKKGRVVYSDLNEMKGIGDVVLKTRY